MEQVREQALLSQFHELDIAAQMTTTTLTRAGIRHAFIGGYATSLLGGGRMTEVLLATLTTCL